MPGRQTQNIICSYSSNVQKESQISFQTENNGLEKMVCLLPNITICNLDHKPNASHSQITTPGLYIYIYGISEHLVSVEIPRLFQNIFNFHDFIPPPPIFHCCGNPDCILSCEAVSHSYQKYTAIVSISY